MNKIPPIDKLTYLARRRKEKEIRESWKDLCLKGEYLAAADYLKPYLAADYACAHGMLGVMWLNGDFGEYDDAKALAELSQGTLGDDGYSAYVLGLLSDAPYEVDGLKYDRAAAGKLFRVAAENEWYDAYFELFFRCHHGIERRKDISEANINLKHASIRYRPGGDPNLDLVFPYDAAVDYLFRHAFVFRTPEQGGERVEARRIRGKMAMERVVELFFLEREDLFTRLARFDLLRRIDIEMGKAYDRDEQAMLRSPYAEVLRGPFRHAFYGQHLEELQKRLEEGRYTHVAVLKECLGLGE